jgi:hypothetical protein
MDIGFKNHFAERFMELTFHPSLVVENPSDVLELQRRWTENALMWHTPYNCIVNLDNATIARELVPDWNQLLHRLHSFHLQKIVGIVSSQNLTPTKRNALLNIGFDDVVENRESALVVLGINLRNSENADDASVKRRVRTTNHFEQRIMEIQFSRPTVLRTEDDILDIRSRIEYNIHQWHTDYCILFDCENLTIEPQVLGEFEKMQRFFRSFFCRTFVGYCSYTSSDLPFQIFRTREAAFENCANLIQSRPPLNSDARSSKFPHPNV